VTFTFFFLLNSSPHIQTSALQNELANSDCCLYGVLPRHFLDGPEENHGKILA